MNRPRLKEAKAQVEDFVRQLEYMNRVWWPWGHDGEPVVIHCGGSTITFEEPRDEDGPLAKVTAIKERVDGCPYFVPREATKAARYSRFGPKCE